MSDVRPNARQLWALRAGKDESSPAGLHPNLSLASRSVLQSSCHQRQTQGQDDLPRPKRERKKHYEQCTWCVPFECIDRVGILKRSVESAQPKAQSSCQVVHPDRTRGLTSNLRTAIAGGGPGGAGGSSSLRGCFLVISRSAALITSGSRGWLGAAADRVEGSASTRPSESVRRATQLERQESDTCLAGHSG